MSDIAISVENLSKRYRIGRARQQHDTLRDSLVAGLRGAGKRLSSLVRGQPSDDRGDGTDGNIIWALKDVSFSISRGEVVGVIGKNGAGKSTLLKVLSRITEPTAGRAEIRGRVGSLLEVGTGFHPELSGRENIYLNGAILGMRRAEIEAKFDEIVAFAEIQKFLDTPVKRYSSGMYVRLAFAVAAHLEPEILLVDEVLAVGDAAFQDKCLGKMSDVARSGRTVLFVSHNLGAIKRLCKRSVWIDYGRIAQLGRTDQVIGAYLDSASSHDAVWRAENEASNGYGHSPVRLCQVSVRNAFGRATDRFQMDSPLIVEMDYDVLTDLENLRFGLVLTGDDGTVIFESKDTDPAGYGVTRRRGHYIARCRIPGDLLNAGRYYASIKIDRPQQEVLFQRDQLLRFVIEATDERGGKPGEGRLGVVRPTLKWEQELAADG